ncbi:prepilin-type N-terminal cleavage/methylation domain-containing protein [Deinococcus sp. RM]|uniref:prepilin-type N-terminal cleavage/methylation domain-containing protein n=1 Tax=Deinococcus sp. RM TaxID=2316359 RepID=UPI000E67BF10|nr:prepilin-type N-terminal cleavage/methylation domain-containing protein [Deinococcus sp. RM]RIY03142.1 prepilin-type N-terminal cleavage/methylation domain-containing protein [Deinococcus sp. RM]
MHNPDSHSHIRAGFTLIEILVATLLLGVLVLTVLAPVTGLFGLSRSTNQRLTTTTTAQNTMEQIKGLWRNNGGNFDRNCLPGLTLTDTVVTVKDLDGTFAEQGTSATPSTATTCGATALPGSFTPVPAKRVKVTTGSGKYATTLTLDIAHP